MVRPVWSKRLSAISILVLVGAVTALIALPPGRIDPASAQPLHTGTAPAGQFGANGPGTYRGVWPPTGLDGPWTRPAPNPTAELSCGIDVALLVDRSGSIERAGKALAVKDAARAVVGGLAGTPSHVGVWSFGESSDSEPGNPDYPAALMTPVGGSSSTTGVDHLDAVIDAIPIGSNASTNWEAGFEAVHGATGRASQPPDLLVVLTDGRPTVHDSDLTTGATTDVEDVDAAVRAANAVKADGTRVFAFGIGGEVDASTLGLIADPVSWTGTNLASAGYALSSFDDLAGLLRQAVSGMCGGSLTVHKVIDDGAGPTAPGIDWAFTLDSPDDPSWAQAVRTDAAGLGLFTLKNLEPVRIAVNETSQQGYRLDPAEVTCQNATGPTPSISTTPSGIELTLGPTDVVSCTFPNHVVLPPRPTETTTVSTVPVSPISEPPTTVAASPPPDAPTPPEPGPATEAAAVSATVAGVSTTRSGSLPRTGVATIRLLLVGLSLVFAGTLLVSLVGPATTRCRAGRR